MRGVILVVLSLRTPGDSQKEMRMAASYSSRFRFAGLVTALGGVLIGSGPAVAATARPCTLDLTEAETSR